jgi:hypothetical protein
MALGVQTLPTDGASCSVRDLRGGVHTGKSEKNGQWCCTAPGSQPDSNTCFNCSQWSFACGVVKSGVAVAR